MANSLQLRASPQPPPCFQGASSQAPAASFKNSLSAVLHLSACCPRRHSAWGSGTVGCAGGKRKRYSCPTPAVRGGPAGARVEGRGGCQGFPLWRRFADGRVRVQGQDLGPEETCPGSGADRQIPWPSWGAGAHTRVRKERGHRNLVTSLG